MKRFYLKKSSLVKYCKPEVVFETNGRKIDIEHEKDIVEYETHDGILPEFLSFDRKNEEVYVPNDKELIQRGLKSEVK